MFKGAGDPHLCLPALTAAGESGVSKTQESEGDECYLTRRFPHCDTSCSLRTEKAGFSLEKTIRNTTYWSDCRLPAISDKGVVCQFSFPRVIPTMRQSEGVILRRQILECH